MIQINDFKPFIQKVWEKEGFTKWTDIQAKAIPCLLEGKDIIAESPTGTGKTLAYILPVLQKLTNIHKHPQVLILAPSRELVIQIHQEIQKFTKDTDILSATFIGGADTKRQLEKLKKKPQILIGSLGRVHELIKAKKIKMHEVKTIIFDECDQLVDTKSIQFVQDIIKTTLKDRQLAFFSATVSQEIQKVAENFTQDTVIERVEKKADNNVEHVYIACEQRDKLDLVRKVIHMEHVKGLAFLNDPFRIDEMAAKLKYRKIKVGVLHKNIKKQERESTLAKFREGHVDLLLATDVAARGLDIEGLSHVIHLDLPNTLEQYIHRSGRTGRMGNAGIVLSFITPYQEKKLHQYTKEMGYHAIKKEIYQGSLVTKKPVPVKRKKQK